MPVCNEELRTTASHRQALWLPALMLMQSIGAVGLATDGDAEVPPSLSTIEEAMNLVVEIPFLLLGNPTVSSFYGEIHISWTKGGRQVALIFFPNRSPLVHHYHRAIGSPSTHDIEPASADRVAYWLRWLRA
jgi:hypothetical protein